MAEINLLNNELQSAGPLSFGKKGMVSFYILLAFLAIELGAYVGLAFYQNHLDKQAVEVEKKAGDVDLKIVARQADRKSAISFQRRLNNLATLLQGHAYWTAVFDGISKVTLKTVQFETMEVDQADHTLVITGLAPSYNDLAKFMLGLRQSPAVQNVTLQNTALSDTGRAGYIFNMEVVFDPKLLAK